MNLNFLSFKRIDVKESTLKKTVKKLVKQLNNEFNNHNDTNMELGEFFNYSRNMEILASEMNLEFIDYNHNVKEKFEKEYELLVKDIEDDIGQYMFENNFYLVKNKKTEHNHLMINNVSSLDVNKVKDLNFKSIAFASRHIIDMLTAKKSTLASSITEENGAYEFIKEVLNMAQTLIASDVIFSLRKNILFVKMRKSSEITLVDKLGIKEALMIKNTLAFESGKNAKDILYDSSFDISGQRYRINYQETSEGFRATIRSYSSNLNNARTLEELGYTSKSSRVIESICSNKNGLMLYTASVGNGKTTSQNVNLSGLADEGLEVITIEDPVEKFMSSVDQIDISRYATAEGEHKITRAKALNSALRSSGDVLSMGEIRDDGESASFTYKASTAGYLVFGTLHTNSVISSISRLEGLGLKEEQLKETVRGIVYQVLARQLCSECKEEDESQKDDKDNKKHYKIKKGGCGNCKKGYSTVKIPIAEIAEFPIFNSFDFHDTNTYKSYISFADSAKEIYDLGKLDFVTYDNLINGRREDKMLEIYND